MEKISRFCEWLARGNDQRAPSLQNFVFMIYSRYMGRITGLKGMRHIALKVRSAARSKTFYEEILGMDVVWQPDPQNVYLSSGCDNLAIHEVSDNFLKSAEERQLDHLGFVVESIERVKALEETFRARGVTIVHPFKIHRDGSASFYCADPDGILIQMIYEPQLSRQTIK
jgi:catechol 2,3-dioxygenase-like lactoylglutathione lyase family enzyme